MTTDTRLIPFRVEHLETMEIRQFEFETLMARPDVQERLEVMQNNGPAFTMVMDGRAIAAGGVTLLMDGVGQAWIIPSKYVHDCQVEFAKVCKRMFDNIMADCTLYRVQTICRPDQEHRKWLKFIGMEKEGDLRCYDLQGNDYEMYSKVKPEVLHGS